MNADMFTKLFDRRVAHARESLGAKAREYALDGDRLHNFKRAATVRGKHPAEVCLDYLTKHWISIMDIVDGVGQGTLPPAKEVIDEKIGNAINYLILLEAILAEPAGHRE